MTTSSFAVRRTAGTVLVTSLLCGAAAVFTLPVPAAGAAPTTPGGSRRACPPRGEARGFSDALNKIAIDGARLGGLSSLARDRRTHTWASTVDNHGTDPARIWFFRDLADPRVVRSPLVLRRPDGTAYDGTTADNEGLALLPDGRYLVSSETEPSIRIFGRDGVEQASLPVPPRFAVTGTTTAGEATANATLEGLALSRDGQTIVAAMEGALSGDVSTTGDATQHRFLVYGRGREGWTGHQIAYRTEVGQRVPEVAVDGRDLIVEEASFDPATGNSVRLYRVPRFDRAPDVGAVDNLSATPRPVDVHKRLLADVVQCPTLGARSPQVQVNPLLDNYEGMALTRGPRNRRADTVGLSLISDDNFSDSQTTRVLRLRLRPIGR